MDFKVVLVDDDNVILFLHKILLDRSKLPSPVSSFINGKKALDFLCNEKPTGIPYLILLDINMPEMNGWEFLEAIQNKDFKEEVYVVMVTSSINRSDIETSKKYPQVIDYLEKPLSKEICDKLYSQMQMLLST